MTAVPDRLAAALADRYRIERELGQGGMATVYLAEDVRHHRKVAVKVLHPELSAVLGPDRFLKEIELTANLQHPHILPLFDSGAVDGLLYYVMPFVEGETLRSRLTREHQLPIAEAVRIATDVADALEYAHKRGVVHRDIKPENILLHEGRPQVADFGIALAVQQAGGSRMTQTGMSLGTPQYMAPEQAMGDKGVDARADVYALGAVTYEMLTGEPPFTGPTAQAIVAKVMTETPRSLSSQRPTVPVEVEGAVLTALEKLPADRFSTAAEFAAALRGGTVTAGHASRRRGLAPLAWSRDPRSRIALGAIGVLVMLTTGALLWRPSPKSEAPSPPMVARLPLSGDRIVGALSDVLANAERPSRTALAISPDGTALVYVGQRGEVRQLFLRPLLGETATPIAGTEGAESPFFSPDGRFVGYWAAGLLMRASFAGGLPTRIAAVERISGASWGEDGRIVVGVQDVGLLRFSATGSAKPDTLVGPGASLPQVLPGGRAIVFSMESETEAGRYVDVLTIASGKRKRLLDDAADARFLPTGHLVFARGGTMLAVPFDPRSLTVMGSPTVVLPDVMQALGGYNTGVLTGAMQAASSPLGHLVYLTGGLTPDRVRSLVWLDRQGRPTPITTVGKRPFFAVRLSPDGTRAAVTALGREFVLYVLDLQRGSEQSLTDPGLQLWPLWSPDGRRILRAGMVRDTSSIVWSPADGSRPAAPLVGNSVLKGHPAFWSPDGTELFLVPGTGNGLYGVTLASGVIRKVENLPEDVSYQSLSPDGKWLAYAATEPGSGRSQVFVQPWPALDRKWKVSTDGGGAPVWTRAGRELIYLHAIGTDSTGDPDLGVMSVTVDPGPDFAPRPPSELFRTSFGYTTPLRNYDVTANGDRFLVIKGARSSAPAGEPRLIVNWFTELRRLSVPQRSNP